MHDRSATRWLVFNGDADGICAAHQLRLAGFAADRVVTGVKRDIALLDRVPAVRGDHVAVADISIDSNRAALMRLLQDGVTVDWYDHHHAGAIPAAPGLSAHIRTYADTCSSLIVDDVLQGRFRNWAVVAAFGDNLHAAARSAGSALDAADLDDLRELGELMNYNAYGETEADLHMSPARLFESIARHPDPRDFLVAGGFADRLRQGYAADMAEARALLPLRAGERSAVYVLPRAAWARRVNGVLANELARRAPDRAHAVLVTLEGGYMVSVRAPKSAPRGADLLCLGFSGGGGRAGAAGINFLATAELPDFLDRFERAFCAASPGTPAPG